MKLLKIIGNKNTPIKLVVFSCVLALHACYSIEPAARPDILFTEQWQAANASDANQHINSTWWESFNSPQLTLLITKALSANSDLRIASERVRQAELQMNIAGASLFPALNISASSGSARNRINNGEWQSNESTRASLGANYEVDLWGRVAASIAAAEGAFNASQYDYESARLSVVGGVASAWFQWLAGQERIKTAEENIQIAERVYHIVEVRYRNGVASAADLARQRTNLLTQVSLLLPLQLQERQTRSALAVLIGRVPQDFTLADELLMELALPAIAAGVPSDILTRRPDLASAEAQLYAADADVSVARAALLPGFQLAASAGKASAELFSLANPVDSTDWSLSLAQSLFNGGRLRNQLKLTQSYRVILIEQYRHAIYIALQEVDDALDRTTVTQQQEHYQREIVAQAERSLRLTEVRYREGSDDLLLLLDAQRSLFQARDQLAQQRLARLSAAVDLYKALGGGWDVDSDKADVE